MLHRIPFSVKFPTKQTNGTGTKKKLKEMSHCYSIRMRLLNGNKIIEWEKKRRKEKKKQHYI